MYSFKPEGFLQGPKSDSPYWFNPIWKNSPNTPKNRKVLFQMINFKMLDFVNAFFIFSVEYKNSRHGNVQQ